MSLPAPWVDKIFAKLTLIYGRDFVGRWEGLTLADVKTDWGHELSGMEKNPKAISHALTNLDPAKPPTVLQFRALALKCPSETFDMLDAPKADAKRIAEELLKMAPIRKVSPVDHKAWAKRIIARDAAGDRLTPISLRFAREALSMKAEA